MGGGGGSSRKAGPQLRQLLTRTSANSGSPEWRCARAVQRGKRPCRHNRNVGPDIAAPELAPGEAKNRIRKWAEDNNQSKPSDRTIDEHLQHSRAAPNGRIKR